MSITPEGVTVIFSGHHTQFNGLRMDVLRKNDNILLKVEFSLMGPDPSDEDLQQEDIEKRKVGGLVEKLMTQPEFTLQEAANVPDAQYYAPDISDYERQDAVFIAPAAGKDATDTFYDVVNYLRKLGGKVQAVHSGPSSQGSGFSI